MALPTLTTRESQNSVKTLPRQHNGTSLVTGPHLEGHCWGLFLSLSHFNEVTYPWNLYTLAYTCIHYKTPKPSTPWRIGKNVLASLLITPMWSFQLASLYPDLLEHIVCMSFHGRHMLSGCCLWQRDIHPYRPTDSIFFWIHSLE